jgi:hemolysin III
VLYDSRRDLRYVKPKLRGWLHVVWFQTSLVFGVLLLAHTDGASRMLGATIFTVTVAGLFGASALYHRGNWSPVWNRRLQRLDHTMIFFVIAGTATPALIIAAPHAYGLICLIAVWLLTLTAVSLHLARPDAPETLVGATFLGLGAVAGLAVPPIWVHAGAMAALLMLGGGLLYCTGAVSYHYRWPDPFPTVFGYHEVFHAYVCAAATVQYFAVALLVT